MMNRALSKLLEQRCKLALGSLALVEKQLQSVLMELDIELKNCYDEPIRGEENHQASFDDPSIPPVEVYDE